VLALGLVIGSGSAAHALNFCFNPGTGTSPGDEALGSLAVAEKFHKPQRGSCSPINGFDIASEALGLGPQLVTGTACLNSTGDTLRVAYVVHIVENMVVDSPAKSKEVSLVMPYPSLVGGIGSIVSVYGTENSGGAQANPWNPQVVPIP